MAMPTDPDASKAYDPEGEHCYGYRPYNRLDREKVPTAAERIKWLI